MTDDVFVLQVRVEKREPKSYIQIVLDNVIYASGCASLTKEDILDKMTQMLLQAVRSDINERTEQRESAWKAT